MRNVLILHGTDASSKDNWFPWLKSELEKRDWEVWVPDLPQADRPSVKRYNNFIFANKSWKFDEDSVLIGHSSGAVAILGLLQHLPDNVVVNVCILVSAFKDDLGWNELRGLFEEPFNFQRIKKHIQRLILIHSDDDPYVPLNHANYLAEKLKGKLIIKKGQGHFNLEKGPEYKKFPLILELLEKK